MQELPEELLEGLALAAGQVISDMEETPAIADVPLLCGAALVRDEVLTRLETLRIGAAASARTGRRAVPEPIAAVIKELMLVGDAVARRSQLFGCAACCVMFRVLAAPGHAWRSIRAVCPCRGGACRGFHISAGRSRYKRDSFVG